MILPRVISINYLEVRSQLETSVGGFKFDRFFATTFVLEFRDVMTQMKKSIIFFPMLASVLNYKVSKINFTWYHLDNSYHLRVNFLTAQGS